VPVLSASALRTAASPLRGQRGARFDKVTPEFTDSWVPSSVRRCAATAELDAYLYTLRTLSNLSDKARRAFSTAWRV